MSDRMGTPEPPRPVRTRLPAEARQASVMYLMSMLTHDDPQVRRRAAGALGRLQDAGALDSLIMVLHDGDPHVQQAAIGALGAIGDPRAIPALRRASSPRRSAVPGDDRGRAACDRRDAGGGVVPILTTTVCRPGGTPCRIGRYGSSRRRARARRSTSPCRPREVSRRRPGDAGSGERRWPGGCRPSCSSEQGDGWRPGTPETDSRFRGDAAGMVASRTREAPPEIRSPGHREAMKVSRDRASL